MQLKKSNKDLNLDMTITLQDAFTKDMPFKREGNVKK